MKFRIAGICVVLAICGSLIALGAFSHEDFDLGEQLKIVLQTQQLPANYKSLPYLSYMSLYGALQARKSLPQPAYIIPRKMIITWVFNDEEEFEHYRTLYRVYFTPYAN
jgi:hypothetical protein